MITSSPSMTAQSEGGTLLGAAPPPSSVWLGYAPTGGRFSLRLDEMKRRMLLAGHRSGELAALLAYACRESDIRVLVIDVDGSVAQRASGYMEHYDYSCFLYDAFEFEEDDSTRHGQLIAAAYVAALNMTSEEEAIMNAALQHLALADTRADPHVLYDKMGAVEGFRGFYLDKLKGRMGSLKYFNAAENGSLRSVMSLSGSLISFRSSRYPQATDLSAAVILAKLLVMLPGAKVRPDVIVLTGAHRIFGGLPRVQHREKLLSEMLDCEATCVLSSTQTYALSDSIAQSFPNKVLSSDAWNDKVENRWREHNHDPILPNAFIIADGHFGHQRTFIARTFQTKVSEPRVGPLPKAESEEQRSDELAKLILDDIARFETPTRRSVSEYLSPEFGIDAVERELDRLFKAGCIRLSGKQPRGEDEQGIVPYELTERGHSMLEMLENQRRGKKEA